MARQEGAIRAALPTPKELTLDFGLDEPVDDAHCRARVAAELRLPTDSLPKIALRKKSVDARRGRVRFHLLFEVGDGETDELNPRQPKEVGERRVLIVGAGPAGLLCAYELARRGIGSTVVDRGKLVQPLGGAI